MCQQLDSSMGDQVNNPVDPYSMAVSKLISDLMDLVQYSKAFKNRIFILTDLFLQRDIDMAGL